MNPTEEETHIDRIEADASNPDLWEEVGSSDVPARTLGASITIRLDPDLAERLRAIARRLGVGYTSLARQMLEERISQYEGGAAPSARFVLDVQVSPSGDVTVKSSAHANARNPYGAAHRADADVSAASVHVGPVVDVEDVNHARRCIDSVHDAIRTASSTAATRQRAEQGLAHTVRVQGERPSAELQDGRRYGLGQGLGDRPAGG